MEEVFKKDLTPEAKKVLFEKGTEAPFSGKYLNSKEKGMYRCINCGTELFLSDTKFDSGTGWPSFDQAIEGKVVIKEDDSFGMKRQEVVCKNCGAHLGHVFDDGPTDTKKRYCINSVCLDLEKENTDEKK
jgi:peptide-methionine (R)-S-oxide reductase